MGFPMRRRVVFFVLSFSQISPGPESLGREVVSVPPVPVYPKPTRNAAEIWPGLVARGRAGLGLHHPITPEVEAVVEARAGPTPDVRSPEGGIW